MTPEPELIQKIDANLSTSLQTLQTRLSRVQLELDLECENLKALLDDRNPEVGRQLNSLQGSITDLHSSLSEVRSSLDSALGTTRELGDAVEAQAEDGANQAAEGSKPGHSPQEAARLKHDAPVSLSGILRGLLMADEPGQRGPGA